MSPLDLFLCSIAVTPAIMVAGLVVNLVVNNVNATKAKIAADRDDKLIARRGR